LARNNKQETIKPFVKKIKILLLNGSDLLKMTELTLDLPTQTALDFLPKGRGLTFRYVDLSTANVRSQSQSSRLLFTTNAIIDLSSFRLKGQKFLSFHIDLNQRGVGGDNRWGAYPHEPFLLTRNSYTYSYIIEPSLK